MHIHEPTLEWLNYIASGPSEKLYKARTRESCAGQGSEKRKSSLGKLVRRCFGMTSLHSLTRPFNLLARPRYHGTTVRSAARARMARSQTSQSRARHAESMLYARLYWAYDDGHAGRSTSTYGLRNTTHRDAEERQ